VICIARSRARALRALFRRSALDLAPRCPAPPLVLMADPDSGLRVRFRHDALAIEQVVPGGPRTVETIVVPFDILADVEGRDDTPVTFEAVAPERTLVRWQDRGILQAREHAVPAIPGLPACPDPPTHFETTSTDLLDALAEATRVTSTDHTRYDLRNLQLRAGSTEIAATDGRQLLLRRTERPVWDHDVLVRRTALFGSKALPRDRPLRVGKTDRHVVLQLDDLTIWLTIPAGGRFPRLDGVLPADSESATCLQLDAEDAAFLAEALGRLPGGDAEDAPVTVDLNGRVAVRARGEDSQPTELILARSGYRGVPVRFSTNREYLGRALALGLGAIRIAGADQPLVAQDARRTFAWQPLNRESAIEPTDNAVRIESCIPPSSRTGPLTPRTAMPDRVHRNGHTAATPSPGDGPSPSGTSAGLADLIREAEALHVTLTQARSQAARLIAGLRGHRRRSRAVAETLRSLRQLGLAEVVE
jgi:hypothetical protein